MQTNTQFSTLAADIRNGAYDHDLDTLVKIITDRQIVMRRNTIDIGDTVQITGQIRPKYMIGATGTVEAINRTTATVRFGANGTRYANQSVRVPIGCVAPVS